MPKPPKRRTVQRTRYIRQWAKPFLVVGVVLIFLAGIVAGNFMTIRQFHKEVLASNRTLQNLTMIESRKTGFVVQHREHVKTICPKIEDTEIVILLSTVFDNLEKYHNLNADLVLSVIETESQFRRTAVSSAAAQGYMQILPSTGKLLAQAMGLPDYNLFDTQDNVNLGCYYLTILVASYGEYNALASYYAGSHIELGRDYATLVSSRRVNWQ